MGPGEDFHLGYRERSEAEPWMARDSVARLGGMLDPAVRTRVEAAVEAELQAAIRFAEESPFPSENELLADLYREA